jgi:hypothetical protein
MTCLKWLRFLNVPLKESCVVFIIWEHIIVVFSFDALFGLTWHMLTPCLATNQSLKPLWSFGFWLVISLYALVNNVLSLCMIMAVIALLVGRSQSFASLHLYWEEILLVHPTTKNQVISKMNHSKVNFHVLPFKNLQNTSHFVPLFLAHEDVTGRDCYLPYWIKYPLTCMLHLLATNFAR